MKKIITLALVVITNFMFCQTINEETFRNDLNSVINDAATGFRESKGAFESKSRWTKVSYYFANKSIFNANKDAGIGYQPADYLPLTKVRIKEEYYFYQGFDYENNSGRFVYDNAERIFDEIMNQKGLKKKLVKQDKKDKETKKEIQYLDKNKQLVLSVYFNLKKKSCSINVYSDLRPDNLDNYYGCLVLYNMQMNSVVSANTYYVYGKAFKGQEHLYNAIRSKMDETSQRLFSKYEWKPNAGKQQIHELLKSLNVRENGSNVDPDGNLIN